MKCEMEKNVSENEIFFPGYILVSADLSFGETQHLITSIPGVIGFLGAGGMGTSKEPVALRQNEVNRILGKVDEVEETEEMLGTPFIVGEGVKVMDGPFSGFTGTVEEIFEDRKKLNVTVKIFGRNTPVELNYVQVEKKIKMAKEISGYLKLQVRGGQANPSPCRPRIRF